MTQTPERRERPEDDSVPIEEWATSKHREHVGAMALAVAGFFHEEGGINYVQFGMETVPEVGPLLVTVQRKGAKTAHQLRKEAETERDAARATLAERDAEVERLREALRNLRINLFSEQMFTGKALDEWVTRQNAIVDAALAIDAGKGPKP